jgi:hypothetical protein
MKKKFLARLLTFVCFAFFSLPLYAQTNSSVPLDDPIYRILDKAQMRGLCAPLSSVRPYSRAVIISAINEILDASPARGALSAMEMSLLKEALVKFSNKKDNAFDFKTLSFGMGHGENNSFVTAEFDADIDITGSAALSSLGANSAWAFDLRPKIGAAGDIAKKVSFAFDVEGVIFRSPRRVLGTSRLYYEDYPEGGTFEPDEKYKTYDDVNPYVLAYSEPLAYFPYTYRKRWDVWLSFLSDLSSEGFEDWPNDIAASYTMLAEFSGTFFNNALFYRFGRVDREWGAMDTGSSLLLNSGAQPFLALELDAKIFSWVRFSTLTGVLEFSPAQIYKDEPSGIQDSSKVSQNAFSIGMLEFNYKQFFHVDFGTSAIWPKRLELGYLFPLIDNYFYQNNIGDNDNIGMFGNFRFQYPGIGKIWLSGFIDELSLSEITKLFVKDRIMYAWQAGASVALPFLPFANVSLRYTKVEPYNYTHNRRDDFPWYDGIPMQTNYVNNGRPLGYYLPPNSDETLLRFETQPFLSTGLHFQYQMIRHGAAFGPHAVDGSSFYSELDTADRSTKKALEKHFLQDGAYEWLHIVKVGGEHKFAKLPFSVFVELGAVFSYFTDIEYADPKSAHDINANSGKAYGFSVVDTDAYPKAATFVATVGVRFFK